MAIFVIVGAVIAVLACGWVHTKVIKNGKRGCSWYLAGPMSAVSVEDSVEWRKEAALHLSVIDPVEVEGEYGDLLTGDPKGLKERFKVLRTEARLDELHKEMQPVLALDFDSVDESFGLLVRVPDEPKFMWGTVREVTLAHQAGKPVVIWCEAKGLLINNTMVSMATAVRATFESAVAACRKIQIGQTVSLTLPEEQSILSGDVS